MTKLQLFFLMKITILPITWAKNGFSKKLPKIYQFLNIKNNPVKNYHETPTFIFYENCNIAHNWVQIWIIKQITKDIFVSKPKK